MKHPLRATRTRTTFESDAIDHNRIVVIGLGEREEGALSLGGEGQLDQRVHEPLYEALAYAQYPQTVVEQVELDVRLHL